MSFTVVWKPSAEASLAAIWNQAVDRAEVAASANAIDALLRSEPGSRGESRDGATRILIVPPLAVVFEVSEEDRTVAILSVRSPPRHRT